ncbi:MAG: amidohydrolase family protein, partial [Woeseiaceae bacterium]
MPETRKIIKNAHVLTLDEHDNEYPRADILISNSTIERIGPDLEQSVDLSGVDAIDAQGLLAMPGLINAHFHSTSAFMKGALEGLHLEPYMLYEAPLKAKWETKRIYYLRSLLTAMDMLKVGITSVRDDAHFFSHPTEDLIDGIFEAFRDAGMRASVALGISNVPETEKLPYLDELLTDAAKSQLPDEPLRNTNELIELYESVSDRWHASESGRLTLHGSVSAPQRVTPEYLRALSNFCTTNNMSLDMHVLETKTQRVHGELLHGKSFVRYVEDVGALNDNT